MKLYSLLYFIAILFTFSCASKDKFEKTPNGYDFKYHVNVEGASPDEGDEIYYRMYVRNSTTVMHRSFDNVNNMRPFSTISLPSNLQLEKIQLRPHEDALRVMSPGDSITIYYGIDSLERKPAGFENENYIFYDLVMLDFKKKEVKVKKEPKPLPVTDFEVTPNGYPVVFHKNEEGASPKVGEYIHFRMYLRGDEGIVFSTEKNRVDNEKYKVAQYIIPKNPIPQMDAFGMMSPGDSLTLYFQIDTMDRKPPGFENSDMVYYDIVLLDILSTGEYNQARAARGRAEEAEKQKIRDQESPVIAQLKKVMAQYKNKELSTRLRTSGELEYVILQAGNGTKVESGNKIKHHFYCMLENGNSFGGSYATGEPYEVIVGTKKIIEGWESGLRLFEEGSKGVLFVPSELAYGENGFGERVPPNTDLVFYIDMVEVRK
ncbi:MAG: FKBP-type peptidyl-prolyl cis-trans isomerase [Bacteroidota bacterium]